MPISLELMPLEDKQPEAPPPKTMVVRYGYLKEIGEFHNDISGKTGCGTKVVVRTNRGTEIAEMLTTVCGNGGCNKSITREKMLEYIDKSGGRDYPFTDQGRVLRVATSQDLLEQSKLDENRQKHLVMARELVQTHKLQMKIVDVEHLLGGERILYYFVSEHRVDFRSLVRDLAHVLHTRIELRQVGARDEARLTADYEKCGQHCCCKQFLKVLTPISMRAAKVQKATLDPTKISGRCGRLMCCLRYEDQTYEELRKKLPKRNTRVTTEKGDAWVIDGQILTQLVLCQFDDGTREAIPMEKISAFDRPKPVMADGRTMQTPNDRPMIPQGDMPLRRSPGGPGGPGGPRTDRGPAGPNGGNLRRPMPGAPANGPAGDPLAPTGPTGGDLSNDPELDDLLADAMDDGATPPAASAETPNASANGAPSASPAHAEEGDDPWATPAPPPSQQSAPQQNQPRPPRPNPQNQGPRPGPQNPQGGRPPMPPRGPQNRGPQQPFPRGPRGPQPSRNPGNNPQGRGPQPPRGPQRPPMPPQRELPPTGPQTSPEAAAPPPQPENAPPPPPPAEAPPSPPASPDAPA